MNSEHLRIVSKAEQAVSNIRSFQREVEKTGQGKNSLAETLSHFRSWYVLVENGKKLYAPSKWIGYVGLTSKTYTDKSSEMDGRVTEAALRKWFAEVPPGSQHDELMEGLNEYLARFGKKASTLARVSVRREEETASSRLAAALIDMYRLLPQEAQTEFQRLLKREK